MSEHENDAWSAPSNEAIVLSLVAPAAAGGVKPIASFKPKYTYTIFNDEQIFGYQDLRVNIQFNASDMRPHFGLNYSKKFKPTGDTEATDLKEVFSEYLPEVAFQKQKEFTAAVEHTRTDWTPPGKLTSTFRKEDVTYEVWKGNLADPAVKQLVNRIQVFVPLYIEGGTYIDVDEPESDRWTIFFLYQKRPVAHEPERLSYVFVGYSTVYRFFLFHIPTPLASPSRNKSVDQLDFTEEFDLSSLPCRTRISQFIVLPPFQQKGIGSTFYSILFQEYLNHAPTVEITVEDPNEAFDDMRDLTDLQFLRRLPEFNALHIDTSLKIDKHGIVPRNIFDKAAAEVVRRTAKIAPRQFYRVLEMHLMSRLPESVRPGIVDPEAGEAPKGKAVTAKPTKEQEYEYRLWQLIAKKRVYRHNKELLGQLEMPERIAKLTETVENVAFDYARLLDKAERRFDDGEEEEEEEDDEEDEASDVEAVRTGNKNGKRKADGVAEAEDEEPAIKRRKA
ncbi:acyl-CoA N-acyltransferase [Lasiosphaeria hispida]|uniref:Histone acetyltransferase type B catalytic subunit n=1 Tax=Lasiosphaeria hispida TaxID=260671 RepID=A0AAJ0MGB0_9PEZI|nr:acyl-CoA N-acyltransferase [Lasiosphaeria hispida]